MPRTLSEEHKKALHEGRQRAAEKAKREKLRDAVKKVNAFNEWSQRDAEIFQRRAAGEKIPYEPMPPLAKAVDDDDFKIVRGEITDA